MTPYKLHRSIRARHGIDQDILGISLRTFIFSLFHVRTELRYGYRRENTDDGNDYHQLDQGETLRFRFHGVCSNECSEDARPKKARSKRAFLSNHAADQDDEAANLAVAAATAAAKAAALSTYPLAESATFSTAPPFECPPKD